MANGVVLKGPTAVKQLFFTVFSTLRDNVVDFDGAELLTKIINNRFATFSVQTVKS